MQLMGDAVTVLGSRLGIAWDPGHRTAYLVRHGRHPGIPLCIHAGVALDDGRTLVLPLAPDGEAFDFADQAASPTTMRMGGIDPETGVHVRLTIRIPFRPRDPDLSTTPAVFLEMSVDRIPGTFRWVRQREDAVRGRVFLGVSGKSFTLSDESGDRTVSYASPLPEDDAAPVFCHDRLAALSGAWSGNRLEADFSLHNGEAGPEMALAWCAHDGPVLDVLGEKCPFHYASRFARVEDVARWAKENHAAVRETSARVDSLIQGHTLGAAVEHLMAQTLHAWLANTWWVVRPDGQEWFTVWEGSCYFHSTVDVEYTQAPFYLSVWPELLGLELQEWPHFAKDGTHTLGERGKGTVFLSHDMGSGSACSGQCYPHEMEVEEAANYLLLAFTHWRRTGQEGVLRAHAGFMQRLADFLLASDTTGNGIPDQGCANTIDDASPAVQYGTEQVYLGVKALSACKAAAAMLEHVGEGNTDRYTDFACRAAATLKAQGWKDDHYVVTLARSAEGAIDPWTGKPRIGELEGWDAYHIYTQNGLALLDMVGYDAGLDAKRLRRDLQTATPATLGRYGCRHSSYVEEREPGFAGEGLMGVGPRVGWISMNMLRDIAAAYRGLDFLSLADRYWDFQAATNTQGVWLFFETFYGNGLCFYPRGVAIYGYLDAAAGFSCDAIARETHFAPIRGSLRVPLLLFANWEQGTAPHIVTELVNGCIQYRLE